MVSRAISSPGPRQVAPTEPESRPTARTGGATPLRVLALGTKTAVKGLDDALALPFRGLVWVYRKTLSPALSPACRFAPSCSEYAAEALRVHGFAKGSALVAWRLSRCQPFSKGGFDPVPPRTARASE